MPGEVDPLHSAHWNEEKSLFHFFRHLAVLQGQKPSSLHRRECMYPQKIEEME
jgi:hypothetical protein